MNLLKVMMDIPSLVFKRVQRKFEFLLLTKNETGSIPGKIRLFGSIGVHLNL